jgi:Protein of unknown function (DUF4245)
VTRWWRPVTASEPTSVPVTEAGVPDAPRSKRASQTVWDMVRSLGLVALILGVTLIFVPNLFHPNHDAEFPAADYSDVTSGFHQVTGERALVPVLLPSGWKANAASLTGPAASEHLHIGWASPGSKYAGLDESVGPSAAFITSILGPAGAAVHGTSVINQATWQIRTSSRGEYAITRTDGDRTIVITGSAGRQAQRILAASLS